MKEFYCSNCSRRSQTVGEEMLSGIYSCVTALLTIALLANGEGILDINNEIIFTDKNILVVDTKGKIMVDVWYAIHSR